LFWGRIAVTLALVSLCCLSVLSTAPAAHGQLHVLNSPESLKGRRVPATASSAGGIICTDWDAWSVLFKETRFWSPTPREVSAADAAAEKYIRQVRPAQSPDLGLKLKQYHRQYVGITSDGRKRIYINYYCQPDRLMDEPILIKDGGDCFFHLEYDIEDRTCHRLYIHGDA